MDSAAIASMVKDAVRAHSMNSARTAQSNANLLGASEIGMCRSYLQRVIEQQPRDEEDGIKWAAFIGTALGDRLEDSVMDSNPGVTKQTSVTATLPSGRSVRGHVDIYRAANVIDNPLAPDPGWVLDFKAKDGLLVAERGEIDRAHLYQIVLYWWALVQAGRIEPQAGAFVVYVDRSGRDEEPVVKRVEDPASYLTEIDDWIDDAIYAVKHQQEASRDRPYEWCKVACPFFSRCRGADEFNASGLIEDPDVLLAVDMYVEALADEKDAKARKEQAAEALETVTGSTGEYTVSSTLVGGSDVAYYRRPYRRLNIRKIKKG